MTTPTQPLPPDHPINRAIVTAHAMALVATINELARPVPRDREEEESDIQKEEAQTSEAA